MNASNFVEGVDLSLYVIMGISVFFLIAITFVMIYFLFKYRKKNSPVATNIPHNTLLEIVWTVIPTILVLIMFWYGWIGYKPMLTAPSNAMEIEAVGQMWKWTFKYPDGKVSDSLVIPIDKPVKLNLRSIDVLHSLYIPAFRIKRDVVPGKDFMMWFTGQKLGRYDIFCAEYCGQLHSYMLSSCTVLSEEGYNNWLSSEPDLSNEHPGLTLLKNNACLSCHSRDGSRIIGPSFKDLIGRQEVIIRDGNREEIIVDEDYIAGKIKNPNTSEVETYQAGLMASYGDILSDDDIKKIIDYISTL
ncbi:MAG: cytochrome c oxidase subunit II [Bacteroidales bacterium]|jgi:cytochrome c oxidase subunit II|nr:cytochrome c oxidase subunit II [Bacteroidales bacterium]MDG2080755.1 cytochrome c oxidase subunit II [Bacteroidales bacterium]|tara:strand:- start:6043 stop:6945 length:903 start_codon:yes stop_codon:yes gene_type:complete